MVRLLPRQVAAAYRRRHNYGWPAFPLEAHLGAQSGDLFQINSVYVWRIGYWDTTRTVIENSNKVWIAHDPPDGHVKG